MALHTTSHITFYKTLHTTVRIALHITLHITLHILSYTFRSFLHQIRFHYKHMRNRIHSGTIVVQ